MALPRAETPRATLWPRGALCGYNHRRVSDERFGRYRLLRRIGAGGMAEVFRAELVGAEGVTRELVVKKILHTLSLDPEAVSMFVEEARLAARLHHPNVVHVYEFGRAGDSYFLAMELVDGCDLAALLRGERPPLAAFAWVFVELLDGLSYVHSLRSPDGAPLGLVHRDVSPHNVLIGSAGEVKLADFGIATVAAHVEGDGVRGKFAYMAPEQASGRGVDARADLFAVGAMLYESLAGRRMYPGVAGTHAPEAVRQGRVEPITAVAPTVHPALAAVVMRAVSADPERRFADAKSFREALFAAFSEAGVVPDREALRRSVQRHLERAQVESAAPAPERTLTVDDSGAEVDSTANDRGAAGDDPASGGDDPRTVEASSSQSSRRVLERVGIAVAIFTLAVLTERKTRPRPASAAVVRVALPDEAGLRGWFEGAPKTAAEQACRCRVELRPWRDVGELGRWMGAGEVDVAAVSTAVLPALDAAGVVGVREAREGAAASLRPEVARALSEADLVAERRIVPAAVDLVVLAWRAEAVRDVGARVGGQREALDRALAARVGTGLPAGQTFERDPAYWTWWDLLSAGWAWRALDGAPKVSLAAGAVSWTARAATAGAAGADSVRTVTNNLDAIEETIGWEAVMTSLGSLTDEDGTATNQRAVNVVIGPARALVGRGERWELSPVPRGDSWLLDAGGARRRGGNARVGEVLGWVVSSASAQRGIVRRAMTALTAPAPLASLAGAWRGLPVRTDASVDDPALRRELAQEEAVLRGGPLSLASSGATQAEVARVERALGALRGEARAGASPYFGAGRWRLEAIRASLDSWLGVRRDAGL